MSVEAGEKGEELVKNWGQGQGLLTKCPPRQKGSWKKILGAINRNHECQKTFQ